MKKIKKTLRLTGLAVMIVLASFGVGLSGGVILPVSKRREEIVIQVELVEEDEEVEEISADKEKR